jgi:hypothetical protein
MDDRCDKTMMEANSEGMNGGWGGSTEGVQLTTVLLVNHQNQIDREDDD